MTFEQIFKRFMQQYWINENDPTLQKTQLRVLALRYVTVTTGCEFGLDVIFRETFTASALSVVVIFREN